MVMARKNSCSRELSLPSDCTVLQLTMFVSWARSMDGIGARDLQA